MLKRGEGNLRALLGLVVILGPVLLVSMDGSILFLAMPRISQALNPSADQALWILDIYGFAVGSLLVVFGNVGDRYGRLRLLMIGASCFGIGSAVAAFAPTAELLIAGRAGMGIAGATLLPSALAVLSELFADPRRRAQAVGVFAAAFAAGFAIGPVIGGVLLERFWWGSVFLVNLPIIAMFLCAAPVLLREVRAARVGRIGTVSVVASAGGLLMAIYGIKHAAVDGLTLSAAVTAILGAGVLVWFGLRQRRLDHPLIDFSLFVNRTFTVAIITGLVPLAAWSATAYLAGIYLQSVLGIPVRDAALLAVPGAVVLTTTCVVTPIVVDRVGKRTALLVCHFSIAAGLAPAAADDAHRWHRLVRRGDCGRGHGYGISFAVVADTAIGAVPPDRAGSAGAIAETSNEIGNALGIALLGSLAALMVRLHGPELAPALHETLQLPDLSAAVVSDAKSAFLTGLHVAAATASALHIVLGLVTLRWLPRGAWPPRKTSKRLWPDDWRLGKVGLSLRQSSGLAGRANAISAAAGAGCGGNIPRRAAGCV
ncbi:MFS transporter [Mycobacterium sp. CBMA293]|uniref:MFS transporter n=1 Tax=unclassified Mycolicibacterium TaxID=2636767 RepID=UPI0012DC81CF|nr:MULTISPECIES: MFS transporter [unclassified Mycolicibacterium]MUL49763.1 MFS transporter [Mycolicibacterium sp. CBMA 360]MUL94957.1 MFS transporter [Mycolicibacterium sp. CBMA 230]MUL59589.1 MFS transporter [Mycolicibacterium sp. CBMA 335]MUL71314.1 MFS transporter [Mycolicibacterium sp. CBMA 311]MUM03795.1 MFS transporter [Mycolicibacterium sp. CBMA 213]